MNNPLISIIMGSDSDLPVMRKAADILKQFEIRKLKEKLSLMNPSFEKK